MPTSAPCAVGDAAVEESKGEVAGDAEFGSDLKVVIVGVVDGVGGSRGLELVHAALECAELSNAVNCDADQG